MAEQQKFTVKVDKRLGPDERLAMGLEIIDFILERTGKGFDKNNKPFPGYSDSYIDSLDFSLAGKSPGNVNLQLSGEMLGAIEVLNVDNEGEITIGIPAGDDFNNGKAEGNIKGTYGRSKPIKGKKRDFMGIAQKDLSEIKQNYLVNNKENREKARDRALELLTAAQISTSLVDVLSPEEP